MKTTILSEYAEICCAPRVMVCAMNGKTDRENRNFYFKIIQFVFITVISFSFPK